jgi:7-keto-8-aminopelargonate synthetase-like enzyme
MLVEVEIITTVITQQFGTLSTGTILRCDKAFADHLVNDANAAKYKLAVKPAEKTVEKSTEPPVNKAKK